MIKMPNFKPPKKNKPNKNWLLGHYAKEVVPLRILFKNANLQTVSKKQLNHGAGRIDHA
jgi:hypothetical protein